MIDRVAPLSRRCLRWIEQPLERDVVEFVDPRGGQILGPRSADVLSPTVPLATRVAEAIGS